MPQRSFPDPSVRAATRFPDGDVVAIWGRDCPPKFLFGFLKYGPDLSMQINIEECWCAGRTVSTNPQTTAICGPVYVRDSHPGLKADGALGPADNRQQPNNSLLLSAVFLGKGESGTIGRERPVMQVPLLVFDPGEFVFNS